MTDREQNKRTAGHKRVNAVFERLRAKADRPAEPGREFARDSLVLLTRSGPTVEAAQVQQAAQLAFGPQVPLGAYSPTGLVLGTGWSFGIGTGSRPYFDHPAVAAADVPELRLREAVQSHTGWLAVDLIDAPGSASASDRLAQVGRLLAALAPPDTLALHRPFTGETGLYTAEAAQVMAAGRVGAAFRPTDQPVPIAAVADDDPRMAEAEAEAHRRFGEFVAALAARRPGDTFAVKAPFEDDHGQEFMWVAVTEVDDTYVHGYLDNDPAFIKSVRAGDRVQVLREQLNDWLFVRNGQMHGGFTLKLVGERLRRPGDAA